MMPASGCYLPLHCLSPLMEILLPVRVRAEIRRPDIRRYLCDESAAQQDRPGAPQRLVEPAVPSTPILSALPETLHTHTLTRVGPSRACMYRSQPQTSRVAQSVRGAHKTTCPTRCATTILESGHPVHDCPGARAPTRIFTHRSLSPTVRTQSRPGSPSDGKPSKRAGKRQRSLANKQRLEETPPNIPGRGRAWNKKTTSWRTPPEIYNKYHARYVFDVFDPCPYNPNFNPRLHSDGLKMEWAPSTFVNCPYGHETIKWVRKAHEEWQKGKTVVLLLKAATDTQWFHEYLAPGNPYGHKIEFLQGRLKFLNDEREETTHAGFPSMIAIMEPPTVRVTNLMYPSLPTRDTTPLTLILIRGCTCPQAPRPPSPPPTSTPVPPPTSAPTPLLSSAPTPPPTPPPTPQPTPQPTPTSAVTPQPVAFDPVEGLKVEHVGARYKVVWQNNTKKNGAAVTYVGTMVDARVTDGGEEVCIHYPRDGQEWWYPLVNSQPKNGGHTFELLEPTLSRIVQIRKTDKGYGGRVHPGGHEYKLTPVDVVKYYSESETEWFKTTFKALIVGKWTLVPKGRKKAVKRNASETPTRKADCVLESVVRATRYLSDDVGAAMFAKQVDPSLLQDDRMKFVATLAHQCNYEVRKVKGCALTLGCEHPVLLQVGPHHAVTVLRDLVFDSAHDAPLPLTKDTLSACIGTEYVGPAKGYEFVPTKKARMRMCV